MSQKSSSLTLVLNDEQRMLQKTARQFVDEHAPVARLRQLRADKSAPGYSPKLWRQMADLGWLGLQIPEQYDGLGLGFTELSLVLEAAGRRLMPEPFVSCLLLGAQALLVGGSEAQKKAWLPGIASGEKLVALAFDETGSRGDSTRIKTSVTGSKLTGEKVQVLDGHIAQAFIVSAKSPETGQLSLFLVEAAAKGVSVQRQFRVDTRNAAIVRFDNVEVGDGQLVGQPNQGGPLLTQVLDRACIGLCAEMVGAAEQAFEDTLQYLKERVQFGVVIGSFQGLQHRAARLYTELAMARSTVLAAAKTADERPDNIARMASLAKAKTSEVFMHVAKEAIQMHGGIGMTDEHDIGFYIKRAQATLVSFGDPSFHRQRWAELHGY